MTPRAADARLPTPIGDLSLTTSTVLWAVVVVLATLLCSRWASTATLRMAHRLQGVHDDLALRAARIVRYFVVVVGAGAVLAVLGADIQPLFVAVLLVAGAALLMLRGIADNLGAGLVIQTRRPVRLGDLVESGGYTGHVRDLNSRSVVLVTLDGRTVHLPNGRVMAQPLVNHSGRGPTRSEVVVEARTAAGHAGDLGRVVVEATRGVRGVVADPAVTTLTSLLADDRVVLVVRFWHAPGEGATVSSRVAVAVHAALAGTDVHAVVSWPPPPHVVLEPPPHPQ